MAFGLLIEDRIREKDSKDSNQVLLAKHPHHAPEQAGFLSIQEIY